jgi:cytochrome P450
MHCIKVYHSNNVGDLVTANLLTSMRNSEHFERADDFIPERWLDKNILSRLHSFAYCPFSAGPRNCIG